MADTQDRSAVTVRIGGEDHVIRTNADPEYTRKCAAWVDERISHIKNQLGLIEGHKAAILAALSITDELLQAKKELEESQSGTTARLEALTKRLEDSLASERPILELDLDSDASK